MQEVETSRYLTGAAREVRLQGHARASRDSDRVGRHVGIGQAGDCARLRHRRHSAGVAEARRRVSRSDHRGRAGPRRRPQHRHAAQHRRRDRGEEDHGARQAAGHAHAVAGRRRGAGRRRRRGSCATACSRTSTSSCSRTSATTSACRGAQRRRHRAGVGRVHLRRRDGAQRRRAVARPLGARRRRADERGLEYRREHLRLSQRSHYVITNGGDQPNVVPRNASIWFYFREIDQPHIKELWEIGNKMAEGAALMTNTKVNVAHPRHRVSAAHEQGDRRNDVREHQDGGPADVERRRSDAGQGAAEGAGQPASRTAWP